ncbi:MAG: hypothetical protein ACI9SY_000559 [Candidatus Paceibacteria bacterium]|jgi:hypothetical protein
MNVEATHDAILNAIETLHELQPEHVLLSYYNTVVRTRNMPPKMQEAYVQQFDPEMDRTPAEVAEAYLSRLDDAIGQVQEAIAGTTAHEAVKTLIGLVHKDVI